MPVPPSLPWAHQTQTDPLPASRKTNHGDCASTGGSAVAVLSFIGRARQNDCHTASMMSISSETSSSGALHHSCTKSESTSLPLSGAYSPGNLNADRVRLYNNKFFYREPMQAQTGNMRRLKIGVRTRLINIVQSQYYGFLNRDVDHRGTDAIEIVLQIQRSQVQLGCF